jgi:hypothetical protein
MEEGKERDMFKDTCSRPFPVPLPFGGKQREILPDTSRQFPVSEALVASGAGMHQLSPARAFVAFSLVEPGDGAELLLSMIRADGSKLSLLLGTGEAVALAAELLQAARVRMGRAQWPARLCNEVKNDRQP